MNEIVVALFTLQQTYIFGSTEEFNQLVGTQSAISSSIQTQSIDLNNDGKNEQIRLNVHVAGVNPADVKQVLVMQSFSYAIKAQVDIEFKMPIFSLFQTPYGFSNF